MPRPKVNIDEAQVEEMAAIGCTVAEIAHTIHAHPTIAESIMEAALDVDAKAIHMPKKKKK